MEKKCNDVCPSFRLKDLDNCYYIDWLIPCKGYTTCIKIDFKLFSGGCSLNQTFPPFF